MRFRDSLALHTCPLLMRVALGATFIWAGLPKFEIVEFTGESAATLIELGIGKQVSQGAAGNSVAVPAEAAPAAPSSQPADEPAEEAESPEGDGDALQPAEGDRPVSDEIAQDGPSGEGERTRRDEVETAGQINAASEGVSQVVKARQGEGIAIMLHNVGHPYPRLFAWVAMITEAAGGALLIIGLFSRVWGLGLAVAMVYAFAFTSLPAIQQQMDPAATNRVFAFVAGFKALDPQAQMGAFYQFILFVASWCIFIGGPGAASLDRLIFRGSPRD